MVEGIALDTRAEDGSGIDRVDFFRDESVIADPYPYFEYLREQHSLQPEPHHGVVMVTGYDFDYSSRGQPITRRITQDFSLIKRVNAAVLSPTKLMIGKNVLVQGDLGAVMSFGLRANDVFTLSFDSRPFPDGTYPLNYMNR